MVNFQPKEISSHCKSETNNPFKSEEDSKLSIDDKSDHELKSRPIGFGTTVPTASKGSKGGWQS